MSPVIEVRNVSKEFHLGELAGFGKLVANGLRRLRGMPVAPRAAFKALTDVTFSANQGEVLGIIGHNGAGKSTLLKLLANISQPTHGHVRVSGRVAPLIEVGAGMVPDMTGRENIYLNASIMGMRRAEINRKFDEIVAFAEMSEFIDTPVKRYSSGMQVKLGFAIATSVEAQVLIVDEVLAVGDLAFQRKCFDRMENLIKREGRTVLLVSHNIRQVERICRRVVLLNQGRIIADGDPKEVCGRFYNESDEKIAKQNKAAVTNSSGELQLLRVELLDGAGEPCSTACTGERIAFDFSFRVNRPIDLPNFGFGIHTTDSLYLATEITEDRFRHLRIAPGPLRVRVVLPRMPFLPGVYSVRIGVDAGEINRNIFYAENALTFTVQSKSLERSQSSTEGFISIDVDWSIESKLINTPADVLHSAI